VKDTVSQGNNYKIYIPSSFTRSGYKLEYFATQPNGSGTVYKIGYSFVPTNNLTLYAQWKKDSHCKPDKPDRQCTFTITYNSNYSGGPREVTDTVIQGNNYKIDIPLSFTRSGYKLEYFATQPNGSGTVYKIGYTFVPTNNLTLYAQWKQDPHCKPDPCKPDKPDRQCTFTITYNSNYDCGPREVTDTVNQGNNYKIDIPLSFTRSGYKLEYFTTQPNGSGTVYKIGYTFVPTNNLTLYAKWCSN